MSMKTSNKLYLAAPWIDKDLMEDRARQFEAWGFNITHKWWNAEETTDDHELCELGYQDLNGVWDSNALVLFNTAKSEGKAVEQGIALGREIPIIAIGKLGQFSNNVFHHLHEYQWCKDIDAALDILEERFGNY